MESKYFLDFAFANAEGSNMIVCPCTCSTFVTSLIVTIYNIKLYSLFYKYTHVLLWFKEREHDREPGPIEWFIETHGRKDKTYYEPITAKSMVIFYFHLHS